MTSASITRRSFSALAMAACAAAAGQLSKASQAFAATAAVPAPKDADEVPQVFVALGEEAEAFYAAVRSDVKFTKLSYARNREASMQYETHNAAIAQEVFEALCKVEVGDPVNLFTADNNDCITFELADRSTLTVAFDGENLDLGKDNVLQTSQTKDLFRVLGNFARSVDEAYEKAPEILQLAGNDAVLFDARVQAGEKIAKLTYLKYWMAGDEYEIDDAEVNEYVYQVLSQIQIGDEEEMEAEDFTDILIFELEDGFSFSISFNAHNLEAKVMGENKLFTVDKADDLWEVLELISE